MLEQDNLGSLEKESYLRKTATTTKGTEPFEYVGREREKGGGILNSLVSGN